MSNYRNSERAPWAYALLCRQRAAGTYNLHADPGWMNPKIRYPENYAPPKIDRRAGSAGYRDQLRYRLQHELGLFTPWQSLNLGDRRLLGAMMAADHRESRRRNLRVCRALGIATRQGTLRRGRYWHRRFVRRCKREDSLKWFMAIP